MAYTDKDDLITLIENQSFEDAILRDEYKDYAFNYNGNEKDISNISIRVSSANI
jgi:hypothetical protein